MDIRSQWAPFKGLILVLAAALSLVAPAPARAQDADIEVTNAPALQGQELEDRRLYEAVLEEFRTKRYAAVAPYVSRIQAALDHAPRRYPAVATVDGVMVVRGADEASATMVGVMAAAPKKKGGPMTSVRVAPGLNVYPDLALMLGAYYVETMDFPRAIKALDQGLKLQPMNGALVSEKSVALGQLHRSKEALRMLDKAIASRDFQVLPHMGPLLRQKGWHLVELGRLDEGQAAYEESLKVEPNHPLAVGELAYIRQQKAGAAPGATPGTINAGDARKLPLPPGQ